MKKLSLIIPFYCNQENIPFTLPKIYEVIAKLEKVYKVELIFVDDGSEDKTWDELLENYNKNYDHLLIKLSKNFGSHSAILAGINKAGGDFLVMITSDLQDSPELLFKMVKEWENGFDIVIAERVQRGDPFFQKLFSKIYYKLLLKYSNTNMPMGGFDCFLIDKKIYRLLDSMSEKNSSITCQISWVGFKKKIIYYKREKRKTGKSMWTYSKKMKLFIDSFVSFSVFPIRLIQIFGFLFSFFGFIYLIVIIILKINNYIPFQGIATVIAILLVSSGLVLLSLSIIGEYLWRVLDETRKRPNFIIDKCLKLNKNK